MSIPSRRCCVWCGDVLHIPPLDECPLCRLENQRGGKRETERLLAIHEQHQACSRCVEELRWLRRGIPRSTASPALLAGLEERAALGGRMPDEVRAALGGIYQAHPDLVAKVKEILERRRRIAERERERQLNRPKEFYLGPSRGG